MARTKETARLGHRQHRPSKTAKAPAKVPNSTIPAKRSAQEAVEDPSRTLYFSMDYGTSTVSLAYRIATAGDQPRTGDDGTFYWGYGVKEALQNKLIKREEIIEHWKLLLYKDHKTAVLTNHVGEQLGGRNIQDLISTHLREVIKEAKEKLKQEETFGYSSEDIENLPMELFLSIPFMWKAPANRIMTTAAKAAGIGYVELVYEPHCAAAFWAEQIKDRLPRQIETGQEVLMADLGGGTADLIRLRFKGPSDGGAKVALQCVGNGIGALCGSEMVSLRFLTWLMQHAGDFKAKCKELDITPTALKYQAKQLFEPIKERFTLPGADVEHILLAGGENAANKFWHIELTSATIQSFFDPVIQEIIDCVVQLKTANTKHLIIPGGFGRSDYLLKRLKQLYGREMNIMGHSHTAVGAYTPVCRGALLRYKSTLARGIPSNEAFGIGRIEVWDPALHPDATYDTDDEMHDGKVCKKGRTPNRAIVEKDPYDPKIDIVYERWQPIANFMNKGSVPGQPYTTESWQYRIFPVDTEEISVQVYWTEKEMYEHDAIRVGASAQDSLPRPGIELWGDPLVMELPNLANLGFEELETDDGDVVYEIYYRLVMHCDGANIKVKWQIALPGTEPYDENGDERDANVEVANDKVFDVCEGTHNPFARLSIE